MSNFDDYKKALQAQLKKSKISVDLDTLDAHPSSIVSTWLPTGCLPLDTILGGGIPVGRVVEFYGDESTGKSLVAAHIASEALELGHFVVMADSEAAVSMPMIEAVGVDTSKLLYFIPDTMEEVFQAFDAAIEAKLVDSEEVLVLIWDSVAASATKAEMEADYGKAHMAPQARLMSASLRKLNTQISKRKVCVILVNQTRDKIGVMFGPSKDTTGGKALKFYTSVRVELAHKGKLFNDDLDKNHPDAVIGVNLQARVVKNKVAAPFKHCMLPVLFNYGIDDAASTFEYLKSKKIINHTGKGWYLCDTIEKKFTENTWPEIYDKHFDTIVNLCGLGKSVQVEEVEAIIESDN